MFDASRRTRWLRWSIVGEIVLLAIQYEIGMSVSIAGLFPVVPGAGASFGTFYQYVSDAGGALVLHAALGILVLVLSVLVLILAVFEKSRSLTVVAAIQFVFVLSAAVGGFLFVLSGFRDNNSSYQMSTGFIVAFVFVFLTLYVLRPSAVSPPGPQPS